MSSSSFTSKIIQVNFTLASGTFDGTHNTLQLMGLRTTVEVEKGGHPSKNCASIKINGMDAQHMNQLTTLSFKPLAVRKNLIQVLAGDSTGLSMVFQGDISEAWVNYQSPPNLYFHVKGVSGYYPAVAPVSPKSYKGATSVSGVMSSLASQMGYAFEDNGVDAVLSDLYLGGTAMDQAGTLADASDIEFGVDDGTLFIAPRGQARKGEAPLISADTGMKEYPVFDKEGLKVECLFNPAVQLGGLIKVESVVPVANGVWRVHGLRHHLESERPGGAWLTKIHASYVGK